MRSPKTIVNTVLALAVLGTLGGLAFVYSGVYNVAATDEHWPATRWLIHVAKERSVALRADDIRVPELGGRERLLTGADAYDQMCAHCHTPPGGEETPVARGLYPAPPDMAHAAEEYSAAEIFWIIKHGIKASGMPAWEATHGDEELWPIVAFVRALPELDAESYQRLVAEARAEGMGHHGAGEGPAAGPETAETGPAGHEHADHRHAH
jgi:mono/diheme cytochrome c family protein